MAWGLGLEPRLTASKAAVLPIAPSPTRSIALGHFLTVHPLLLLPLHADISRRRYCSVCIRQLSCPRIFVARGMSSQAHFHARKLRARDAAPLPAISLPDRTRRSTRSTPRKYDAWQDPRPANAQADACANFRSRDTGQANPAE
jgi:hypothetical protein